MLLSNSKIDYSTVRRMPPVKLSGQTQGTTINTMPTSTSLQDINSHAQKFTWNDNEKDQRLVNYSEQLLSSNPGRPLGVSHSDELIFEHPEVTIKPSSLDDEIQRRLLTMKTSNTSENLPDREGGKSVPNILEHPDMRSPVVMQPQQLSSSSSSSLFQYDNKRVSRTQSAELETRIIRTPSPRKQVDFYIDNRENSKRSTSPGSCIGNILESPEQEKSDDLSSSTLTKTSPREYSTPSSNSDIHPIKAKKNDSW